MRVLAQVGQHAMQQRREFGDVRFRAAGEQLAGHVGEDGAEARHEGPGLVGDDDDDGAAVVRVWAAGE